MIFKSYHLFTHKNGLMFDILFTVNNSIGFLALILVSKIKYDQTTILFAFCLNKGTFNIFCALRIVKNRVLIKNRDRFH